LDKEFQWLSYEANQDTKTATKLHSSLHQLLSDRRLKLKDIQGLIQIAGPGGYTGMRISDGIFQTLKLFGIPSYSFYHFEVPSLLDEKQGLWISNAFKGEIFTYSFSEGVKVEKLWSEKDFIEHYNTLRIESLYTHNKLAFSPSFNPWAQAKAFIETGSLIEKYPQKIFSSVVQQKLARTIFYYRPIEGEFKKPN
jgi:tRNA threonylcarbamoyladenosine biosynthesis protein TsaB